MELGAGAGRAQTSPPGTHPAPQVHGHPSILSLWLVITLLAEGGG